MNLIDCCYKKLSLHQPSQSWTSIEHGWLNFWATHNWQGNIISVLKSSTEYVCPSLFFCLSEYVRLSSTFSILTLFQQQAYLWNSLVKKEVLMRFLEVWMEKSSSVSVWTILVCLVEHVCLLSTPSILPPFKHQAYLWYSLVQLEVLRQILRSLDEKKVSSVLQWCSKESLRALFYEAKVLNSDGYSTI